MLGMEIVFYTNYDLTAITKFDRSTNNPLIFSIMPYDKRWSCSEN